MNALGRRGAHAVLIGVIALPWVAFALAFATGRTPEPQSQRPTWVHLLVLTSASVDAPEEGDLTAMRRALDEGSIFIPGARSPALATAAAAASLWTGRWPIHHGVVSNDRALPGGTWTLATAARGSGAKTAAFLAEPFVEATNVGGFDTTTAAATLGVEELTERARRWLDVTPGRFVLWLHLGPDAGGVPALMELARGMEDVLAGDGRLLDTARVVTSLGSRDATTEETRFAVPLWFSMPARLWAGRQGIGTINLVDLAEPLRNLMAVPGPGPGRPALQSRAPVAPILRGASAYPQHLLMGHHRTLYVDPAGHLSVAGRPPTTLAGRAFETEPADARDRITSRYERFIARLRTGATEAQPAPTVAGFTGWSD